MNSDGQLGLGYSGFFETSPKLVGTGWIAAAGGGLQSLGLLADGTLWAWGQNGAGQLGLRDYADRNTPTQVKLPGVPPGIYLLLLGN